MTYATVLNEQADDLLGCVVVLAEVAAVDGGEGSALDPLCRGDRPGNDGAAVFVDFLRPDGEVCAGGRGSRSMSMMSMPVAKWAGLNAVVGYAFGERVVVGGGGLGGVAGGGVASCWSMCPGSLLGWRRGYRWRNPSTTGWWRGARI